MNREGLQCLVLGERAISIHFLIPLALTILIAGCARVPPETREADILAALIESLGLPHERLLLMSYPSNCAAAGPPQRIPALLFDRLKQANAPQSAPQRLETLGLGVKAVTWDENLAYLEDPELVPLESGQLLLLVSRIGYAENERQALLCAEVSLRGGRRSYLVLLDWLGERDWQVTGEFGVEDRAIDKRRPIHS